MTNATDAPTNSVDYGDLGWLLTSFARRIPTIEAALAVSVDGLAIAASENVAKDQADHLAAITSGLASLTVGAAALHVDRPGTPDRGGHGRRRAADHGGGGPAFLAVQARPGADLGQVGYETAVLAQRVATALEPTARTGPSPPPHPRIRSARWRRCTHTDEAPLHAVRGASRL